MINQKNVFNRLDKDCIIVNFDKKIKEGYIIMVYRDLEDIRDSNRRKVECHTPSTRDQTYDQPYEDLNVGKPHVRFCERCVYLTIVLDSYFATADGLLCQRC